MDQVDHWAKVVMYHSCTLQNAEFAIKRGALGKARVIAIHLRSMIYAIDEMEACDQVYTLSFADLTNLRFPLGATNAR